MQNTQGSRLSWEVAGYSESIHMWVLTFDITILYAYQPKYITDHGFNATIPDQTRLNIFELPIHQFQLKRLEFSERQRPHQYKIKMVNNSKNYIEFI